MSTPPAVVLRALQAGVALPLRCLSSSIAAGFPSPADDYIDKRVHLN
jgi:hypothetical protein